MSIPGTPESIRGMRFIEARNEEDLLKPEAPLPLTPGERVALLVVRHPDPRRWDLARLARSGKEDRALLQEALFDLLECKRLLDQVR